MVALRKTDLLARGQRVQLGVEARHGLISNRLVIIIIIINERRTCLHVERAYSTA
jgi:hypothetical protein